MSSCLIALALGVTSASGGPAHAQTQRGDQDAALRGREEGRILPLREIERRVLPTMQGAQYLGFDFDADDAVYTLKFLRDGTVIWVDVDGRTGQIIRKTGG